MESPDPPCSVPPSLTVKPRLVRQLLLPIPLLLLMLGFGYGGYRISESAGIRALAENGERQLELHARTVESEISKYTYLPSLLELERSVSHLLTDPTPYRRNQVNAYLEGLNRRAGSRAVYLLDTNGRVLATSNWSDPDSYLGEDLSFRAYWQDAMKGKPGRFYGIGSTRGEPGYYLAHGLVHGGRIIGVAVVKVKMDALEERWEKARLEAFVSDENGIIILSSNPALRLKAVRSLSADDKERLARSMQYYWWALNEWQPLLREPLAAGVEKLSFPADEQHPRGEAVTYLAQTRALNDTPWNLTLLSPLEDLRRDAVRNGMLAAIGFALLAFLLIAWNERRKVLAPPRRARGAATGQRRAGSEDRRTHRRPAGQQRTPDRRDPRAPAGRGHPAQGPGRTGPGRQAGGDRADVHQHRPRTQPTTGGAAYAVRQHRALPPARQTGDRQHQPRHHQ